MQPALISDMKIVKERLVVVLCSQTCVGEIALHVLPFMQISVIEHLELVGNDKRNYIVVKTFLKHDESPYTPVSVLEGVYTFKLPVKIQYVDECYFLLFLVCFQQIAYSFSHQLWVCSLYSAHLVRESFVVANVEP